MEYVFVFMQYKADCTLDDALYFDNTFLIFVVEKGFLHSFK